jgi:hypothetical protein
MDDYLGKPVQRDTLLRKLGLIGQLPADGKPAGTRAA